MEKMSRREMCAALSAFAALAVATVEAQKVTQQPGDVMAVPPPPGSTGDPVLAKSHTFGFEGLPVVKTGNGESRAVSRGVLATGEAVEIHETKLLPGHMPHPPHKHRHSEFMMVREGTLEFENEGKPERVGPGGVIFAASNLMHGLKNVGDTPAQYFVIAIGRETPA